MGPAFEMPPNRSDRRLILGALSRRNDAPYPCTRHCDASGAHSD